MFARRSKAFWRRPFQIFEFVIVDDGAVDESVAKVQQFTDPRIRLFRQSNQGLAAVLNLGIREARGALIVARMPTTYPIRNGSNVRFGCFKIIRRSAW